MGPVVRRLLPVLVVSLAACESPLAPSNPKLAFEGQVVFGFPTLPTVASAEAGGILVTGALKTPTTGYLLQGVVKTTGARSLRLDVDAYLSGDPLPFQTQNYYRAHLQNLAAGSYDVMVVHVFHYTLVETDTVYRATVRVQ